MTLTRIENEKLVDSISGKEIRDLYGSPQKNTETNQSKPEENQSETKEIMKMVWIDLLLAGQGFPISRFD